MILVPMERGDPTLYYGTKQLYFWRVNFKIKGGGKLVTTPLGRRVTKKKKAQEDDRGLIYKYDFGVCMPLA